MARRCLIIACSQRKRDDAEALPAIQRYDGPAFRVVRKFLAEADSALQNVDIYVLSAAYGLISGDKPIADYDQRMTETRAEALRPKVVATLGELLASDQYQYDEVFLSLGKDYLRALEGYEGIVPASVTVVVSQAAFGRRLTELKRWLYRSPEESRAPREPPAQQLTLLPNNVGRAVIRGHTITASPDEVLAIAREALQAGHGDPQRFRSWYVLVDRERVGAKWLVSMLTGLPPPTFDASEARRVLRQLGMMVHRDG